LSYKAKKENEEQKKSNLSTSKKNELAKYQEAITYYNEFGKNIG
jgi:cobalt-zinc-cadmium resistance protein CzcA